MSSSCFLSGESQNVGIAFLEVKPKLLRRLFNKYFLSYISALTLLLPVSANCRLVKLEQIPSTVKGNLAQIHVYPSS